MICTVYEKAEGRMGDRGEYIRWGEGDTPEAALRDARKREHLYAKEYKKPNAFLDSLTGNPMRDSEFILITQ
jgi:hypothetical protein